MNYSIKFSDKELRYMIAAHIEEHLGFTPPKDSIVFNVTETTNGNSVECIVEGTR